MTENRGSENIWLKIRARPKLTTRIFGHLWPVTSTVPSQLSNTTHPSRSPARHSPSLEPVLSIIQVPVPGKIHSRKIPCVPPTHHHSYFCIRVLLCLGRVPRKARTKIRRSGNRNQNRLPSDEFGTYTSTLPVPVPERSFRARQDMAVYQCQHQ